MGMGYGTVLVLKAKLKRVLTEFLSLLPLFLFLVILLSMGVFTPFSDQSAFGLGLKSQDS